MPYIALDPRPFTAAKVSEADAEGTVAEMLPEALESTLPPEPEGVSQTRLPPRPMIRHSYTRVQMAAGQLPATEEGRLILHSYSPNGGWFVMVSPGMYEVTSRRERTTFRRTRMTGMFRWRSLVRRLCREHYHDRVAPVDIAATFASLLRVNQPSACVGHVLTQAIKPETARTSR